MKFAESEYKKRNNKPVKKDISKIENKPDWFDKNIEENTASMDEIKALEQRIGSRENARV